MSEGRNTRSAGLLGEAIHEPDFRLGLNAMAIEEGGTIAPVANRGDCRFDKQWRATDLFETLDGAILADYSAQTNRSFQALLPGI
jgi:hypothetical protein